MLTPRDVLTILQYISSSINDLELCVYQKELKKTLIPETSGPKGSPPKTHIKSIKTNNGLSEYRS